MSVLMPQGAWRHCMTGACGYRFFTTYTAECACPHCGRMLDAVRRWPYVCTNGHSAHHGGRCAECDAGKKTPQEAADAFVEWVNR